MDAAMLVQAMKCNHAIARMTAVEGGITAAYSALDKLEAMVAQAPEPAVAMRTTRFGNPTRGGAPAGGVVRKLLYTQAVAAAA